MLTPVTECAIVKNVIWQQVHSTKSVTEAEKTK